MYLPKSPGLPFHAMLPYSPPQSTVPPPRMSLRRSDSTKQWLQQLRSLGQKSRWQEAVQVLQAWNFVSDGLTGWTAIPSTKTGSFKKRQKKSSCSNFMYRCWMLEVKTTFDMSKRRDTRRPSRTTRTTMGLDSSVTNPGIEGNSSSWSLHLLSSSWSFGTKKAMAKCSEFVGWYAAACPSEWWEDGGCSSLGRHGPNESWV